MITLEDLRGICYAAKVTTLGMWVEHLNNAMEEFEISTPERQAAFLAQIAHESGEFRYVREIASGDAYEGRADLGNVEPGDGRKYRGRGLIQCTGRSNYAACAAALGIDCLEHPELLETYANAARSAGWWWKEHGCNELADKGDLKALTRRINGGMNGYKDRLMYWERAKSVFGVA